MKWKTPKYGERLIKKHFAFFPVALNNRITIWLEFYYTEYEYRCDIFNGDRWFKARHFQQ